MQHWLCCWYVLPTYSSAGSLEAACTIVCVLSAAEQCHSLHSAHCLQNVVQATHRTAEQVDSRLQDNMEFAFCMVISYSIADVITSSSYMYQHIMLVCVTGIRMTRSGRQRKLQRRLCWHP